MKVVATRQRQVALGLLLGLALLAAAPGCIPRFPADDSAAANEDVGSQQPDSGSEIDAGRQRDGGRGCGPHSGCEPPQVCRQGRCTAECESADDCDEQGTACLNGRCLAPCAAHSECEVAEACQAGFGCVPYCDSNSDCPDPLVCRSLNSRAKLCVCARDLDCGGGQLCVEGQCVSPCTDEAGGGCDDLPGRQCLEDLGRCFAEECDETADPICGNNVNEFCLVSEGDAPEPGLCTRGCTTTDRGDGDSCGVGFRCQSYGDWTFCLPVGNLTAGDACETEGLSWECTTSFCFWGTCTVLCNGLLDTEVCREHFGAAGICRRTDTYIEADRLWACDPVVP